MTTSKFRKPNEMTDETEERVPVSARIKASTREFLDEQAEANGLSLAHLLANVLEDYTLWLRDQNRRKK